MRYLALACDYDGTLAHHSQVNEQTVAGLERVIASGRKLLLVTGRELEDLFSVFPYAHLFEWIVGENGALLYRPATREVKLLAERPPGQFVEQLRERGVAPMSIGHVIVATWEPHETAVLETIRDLGLELQVIFNKGAVMVLPAGVNKASGLSAALVELSLSPHNVAGIGDAENDHALLSRCECGVAVANALPGLKERADFVTQGDHGAGVVELIDKLVANDLKELEQHITRHQVLLGLREDGSEVKIHPYGANILVAGTSGSGKSTLATGFMERLAHDGYQLCIVDPEGDYSTFEHAIVVGNNNQAPAADEVLQLLQKPDENVVVNMLGISLADRPQFFRTLLPHLLELRVRVGRPHWILIDEAHHLLPTSWEPTTLPQSLEQMIYVTVHPDQVSSSILSAVDTILAVGEAPEKTLAGFSTALEQPPPTVAATTLASGEALVWLRQTETAPFRLRVVPGRAERRRHRRKYAEGELPPDRSFYFQGAAGKLNLRAQNLILFMQLADGVDDETWLYHLHRGDYSRWFREAIKDDVLAAEAARVEGLASASPHESRELIKSAIQEYYTVPVDAPKSLLSLV